MNTNVVVLTGNLTRDPELRHTPSGTPVASLRLAVNDRVKKDGEWQDAAYFFDVTVWANAAERCAEYLSKGRKVAVTGKLTWREWQAQDGTKRQAVEVVAQNVEFLGPRGEGGGGDRYEPADFQPAGTGGEAGGGGDGFRAPEGAGQVRKEEDFTAGADDSDQPFVPAARPDVDDDIPF